MSDYIKREDVLELSRIFYDKLWETGGYRNYPSEAVPVNAIRNIPSADVVEMKRGKWEYDLGGIPQCSCCEETALQRILLRFPKPEYVSHFVLSNFCPHCGARMDGET